MNRRYHAVCTILLTALLAAGCPKGGRDFKEGEKAELQKDYDTALIHYERALQDDPKNPQYQIRAQRMRFEAAQKHVDEGNKLLEEGLLEPALAEFEKAHAIDPSSFIAEQQIRHTKELITEKARSQAEADAVPASDDLLALENFPSAPPRLKPVTSKPFNLRMNEDAKAVFQAIGELGGINVVFDPDFQSRRVQIELNQTTVEQALDILALMTKTFWKPVTPNTILVSQDQQTKRQAYEEKVIKTFYLENITEPNELNELVQGLRQLLDIKNIVPSTTRNAIIIRDTYDKVVIAEKIIKDVDRAKPEVVVQVAVLQARRDRARELGIVPSTSVPLIFTPRSSVGPETTGEGGASGAIRLDAVDNVSSEDYSLVLPSATAMALLTDSTTKIIQNPQIRTTDGQTAKLNIGDRVPFAVGSFQPGIGGVGVNPLVNTQFQFQDVGVNLDITPRVHTNREITLKVTVEVSSVTNRVEIGGIEQPIFGQRKIEHDIRLKEGEVSILGGIVERGEDVSLEGWPGLSRVPFLRYFFSSEEKNLRENEVLIVLTPRVIRLPEISDLNRRSLAVGTDTNIALPRPLPAAGSVQAQEAEPVVMEPAPAPTAEEARAEPEPQAAPAAALRFDPTESSLQVGQQVLVNVVVDNVQDLYALPFAVSFDPQVAKLVDVRHGGFMGGEDLPPALVHRVNEEVGTAIISISRPPEAQGVSGSGTLVTLVFEGLAPGQTTLAVPQISARDSARRPLTFDVRAASLTVVE